MKRGTLFAGIGIALFLVLGIIIITKLEPSPESEGEPPTEIETVLEIPTDDAEAISVVNGDEDIELNKIAGVWVIDDVDPEDTSSSKVDGLVSNALTYKTDMKLTGTKSDYGLDEPGVTIKVKAGEKEHTILIGDRSAVDDVYFASADDVLFSMSLAQYNNLTKALSYYTEVARMQVDADDITGVKLEQADRTIDIYLPEVTRLEGNVWYMRSPYATLANDTFIDSDVLPNIASMSLSNKADELGAEQATLTITTSEKEYVLTIGEQDGGSVMVEYEGRVYSEAASLFSFITADTFEFMNKLVSYVNINDVSEVILDYDGASHDIKISGETNNMNFDLNGKSLDSDTGKTLYSAIIGVTATALYNNEPLGDTVMAVTFKGKDGSDTVVEYKSVNEYTLAVVKNGTAIFITGTHDVENLKTTLNNE